MTRLNSKQSVILRDLIKKHQLESVGEMLEAVAQSAVQIVTSTRDDYFTLGNSRIGGLPDLPLGVQWPDIEGWYLVFVAQINLAELPRAKDSPLPQQGILYFFHGRAEPAVNIINSVLFFDGPSTSLKRAEQPDIQHFNEEEDWAIYSPCNVLMKPHISTPHYSSELYQALEASFKKDNSFQHKFPDRYFALQDDLRAFDVRHNSELSQILGFPTIAGGSGAEPARDAQKSKEGKYIFNDEEPDIEEVKKWHILFELGSHDQARMCWWDAGYLQFLIHQNELTKLDFSHCYADIQSS